MTDLLGERVRVTVDNMGAVSKRTGRMTSDSYPAGTEATVVLQLPDSGDGRMVGWWALELDDDPAVYIPAHVSMFEPVGGESQ